VPGQVILHRVWNGREIGAAGDDLAQAIEAAEHQEKHVPKFKSPVLEGLVTTG
jgi:hypothetical protein